MRYVESRIKDEDREETYRAYVTKSLQLIPQSKFIESSYYDIVHKKVDNRSGNEIAVDIMQKAGLKFKQ